MPPWLKNRRVWLIGGAGVAAALGLAVAYRRLARGATSGSTTVTPATVDTSGADAYNAVQDVASTWTEDLRRIADQLGQVSTKLDQLPTRFPVQPRPPGSPGPGIPYIEPWNPIINPQRPKKKKFS